MRAAVRTAASAVKQRSCHATTMTAAASCRRGFATAKSLEASYGFIGLGQMGYPMARNLRNKISQSDTMHVHDVNPKVTEEFAKEVGNVTVAETVRQVAGNSETIITVLPEPHHVQNVFQQMLRPPTLLTDANVTRERLFIDCSTIDPKSSAQVANACHSSSQGKFVDAPMSGGVVGASAGTLTFMIGCQPELVSRVTEILSLMGKRTVHLGPQTSGLKGKLANNYLLALNNIATAEAMHMGVKWGLDPTTLADMINSATGKCWPSEANNPVPGVVKGAPASKDYQGGFGTKLMLKDLRLALQAGTEADIIPQLGAHAQDIYTAVNADEKCKDRDFSVVYRYIGGKE